ncbi:MAG: hypothetical protein Q4A56_05765 [Porphyromonadaceae bacterium]|nr:hypothetical protein [Porphyromonadaceae bacterium]
MKYLFTVLMLITFFCQVWGQYPSRVPATPNPITFTQPNGDTIEVRLFGDERQHYYTTLDGYVIVKDANGYFCYGKINRNKKIVASKHIVDKNTEMTPCKRKYLKKISKNSKLKKVIQ